MRSKAEHPGDVGKGVWRGPAGPRLASEGKKHLKMEASQDGSIPKGKGAVHEAEKLVLTPKYQNQKVRGSGNRLMQKSLQTLSHGGAKNKR